MKKPMPPMPPKAPKTPPMPAPAPASVEKRVAAIREARYGGGGKGKKGC